MSQWTHTVSFSSFWDREDLSIKDKANFVAARLEKLKNQIEKHQRSTADIYELEDIIEGFKGVSETPDFSFTEDFDEQMCRLYDWADQNSVWVAARK